MDEGFYSRWEAACRRRALREWSRFESKVGNVGEAFFSDSLEVTMVTQAIGWLRDTASDSHMAHLVDTELERRGLALTDEELGRVASSLSLTKGPMFGSQLRSQLDRALYAVKLRRDLEASGRDGAGGEPRHASPDLGDGLLTVESGEESLGDKALADLQDAVIGCHLDSLADYAGAWERERASAEVSRPRADRALAELRARADAVPDRWPSEALGRVTEELMGNGTVYDARAGLLFESYAKEPGPTVELFHLEPSELASSEFSDGEHSCEAQPGRHVRSFDVEDTGDIAELNSLAQVLSDDLEAADATLGGDMEALTGFASTWERAHATEQADEAGWEFSDPALGGLTSGLSPELEDGDADRFAVLDTLRRGSSFYSGRLGVLVTPMPSDKSESGWACVVTREVAPDILASAVSDYERHLSREEGDEYGYAPRSLKDASPYIEAHGQPVVVEGDSPDMDSLVALVSKAGAGFEADGRGGDAYGRLLARGRVAELVEEGPVRDRAVDGAWARDVLEGPEDLWSPERGILAVSYMDPMNSTRDVEVYEGVTEDVMRGALADAGPGAKLSDASEGLECTYVVSAADEASMRGLCGALAADASFMTGDDAIRGMEATDALRLWLDRENVARDPVGATSAEDRSRGRLAVSRCEDMGSLSIGVFARSAADASGSVTTEVCVGLQERDWADVASYESSLSAGDPTVPDGLGRRLEGAMRIPEALPSGSELVGSLVGNPAFGFSPASAIEPTHETGAGVRAADIGSVLADARDSAEAAATRDDDVPHGRQPQAGRG